MTKENAMLSNLDRVYEPDEDMTHYASPSGTDQVTLCGITDWIGQSKGQETGREVSCNGCNAIADMFVKAAKKGCRRG